MLVIQPEDCPTATSALSHGWLASPKSNNEDSRDDRDEVTQSQNESTKSKSRDELATHGRPKEWYSERNPIIQDRTRCISRDVAAGADLGLPRGGYPINTPPGLASIGSSEAQPSLRKSEFTPRYSQPPHPTSSNGASEKQIDKTPQTYLPGIVASECQAQPAYKRCC